MVIVLITHRVGGNVGCPMISETFQNQGPGSGDSEDSGDLGLSCMLVHAFERGHFGTGNVGNLLSLSIYILSLPSLTLFKYLASWICRLELAPVY